MTEESSLRSWLRLGLLHCLMKLEVKELLDACFPHLSLLPDTMIVEQTRKEQSLPGSVKEIQMLR
jgi:hypothetical protein